MQNEDAVYYPLTLQGHVFPALLATGHFKWGRLNKEDIVDALMSRYNEGWFFIDYAYESIPTGCSFASLIEQDKMQLLSDPCALSVKILYCFTQFGNLVPEIPRGWKTICKIQFNPAIPIWVRRLKILNEWNYNPLNKWDYNPSAITLLLKQ